MLGVYRIQASRTELHLVEAYVKAANPQEAESIFYGALEHENAAISWTQVFDSSDTEIDSIEPVPAEHDPLPSEDRTHCLLCGRSIRWTGVSAEDSPSGISIPGPWVHVDRQINDEDRELDD
jgi:hypothetical protein